LLLGRSLAYVAPFLSQKAEGVRFIGITEKVLASKNCELGKMVKQKISNFDGPPFFVSKQKNRILIVF
jgi:hypothetical protein